MKITGGMAGGLVLARFGERAAYAAPGHWWDTELVRPVDLLSLRFRFLNYRVPEADHDRVVLRPLEGGQKCYLVVGFPPQSLLEQAFPEQTNSGVSTPPPDKPPVWCKLASDDGTRLVFEVLPDHFGDRTLLYTPESLLEWSNTSRFRFIANGRALQPRAPKGPGDVMPESSIEMPAYVFLQPQSSSGWINPVRPVISARPDGKQRSELWRAVLAPTDQNGVLVERSSEPIDAQVAWAADYAQPIADPNLTFPLSREDRHDLVYWTSSAPGDRSRPVHLDQLMLSSLGGWLSAHGDWDPPPGGNSLEHWGHRATQGRDHYCQVVRRGWFYPFGHRAAFIKLTERKFQRPTGGNVGAFLRQRCYVVVTLPDNDYAERDMPFSRLRVVTARSGDLDSCDHAPVFVPTVGGKPFVWHLEGTDRGGKRVDFQTPLVFIDNAKITDAASLTSARTLYASVLEKDKLNQPANRFAGQHVAYADVNKLANADASMVTDFIAFNGNWTGAALRPRMERAQVHVPALRALLPPGEPIHIRHHPAFVTSGFDNLQLPHAKVGAFAELLDAATLQPFAAGKGVGVDFAGGSLEHSLSLIAPNLQMNRLSATMGPLAGEDILKGTFNPASFFGDDATLLGGISLKTLVASLGFTPAELGKKIPRLVTEFSPDGRSSKLTYSWVTDKLQETGIFIPRDDPRDHSPAKPASLELTASIVTTLDPEHPVSTNELKVSLKHFSLRFLSKDNDFLTVSFEELTCVRVAGKSPDVTPKINNIKFGKQLNFIADLIEKVNVSLLRPIVDLSLGGLKVGAALSLPPIAMGAFSLQNVSFGLAVHLPFVNTPALMEFSFADRRRPFLLQVGILGGGGFFSLQLAPPAKIVQVEGAFEFGGCFAIDLGVASGRVYLLAGIYFRIAGSCVEVEGYVRCGGALDILGLITVSVEFFMGLKFLDKPDGYYLTGRATVTVSIELLFFSASVSLSVERTFLGHQKEQASLGPHDACSEAELREHFAAFGIG